MKRAPSASSSPDKPRDFSLKWQHVTALVGLSIVPSVVAVTVVEATVATVDAFSMPRDRIIGQSRRDFRRTPT